MSIFVTCEAKESVRSPDETQRAHGFVIVFTDQKYKNLLHKVFNDAGAVRH